MENSHLSSPLVCIWNFMWVSTSAVKLVMISLMHKWLKTDAFKSKLVINPTTSSRLSRDIHCLFYGIAQAVEAFARAVLSWRRKSEARESREVKYSRQCSGREEKHFYLSPLQCNQGKAGTGVWGWWWHPMKAPPAAGTAPSAIPACENPGKMQIPKPNQVRRLLLLKAFVQQYRWNQNPEDFTVFYNWPKVLPNQHLSFCQFVSTDGLGAELC